MLIRIVFLVPPIRPPHSNISVQVGTLPHTDGGTMRCAMLAMFALTIVGCFAWSNPRAWVCRWPNIWPVLKAKTIFISSPPEGNERMRRRNEASSSTNIVIVVASILTKASQYYFLTP
uniref:Secreted protein n=1 Tax=Ascaris lumbricoides TaxID=6252 RepID=A0A9J2P0G0_ASCLU